MLVRVYISTVYTFVNVFWGSMVYKFKIRLNFTHWTLNEQLISSNVLK